MKICLRKLELSKSKLMDIVLVILLASCCSPWSCPAGSTLSGDWESTLSVDPPADAWFTEVDLSVEIAIGDWIAELRSVFKNIDWTKQDFSVEGTFGNFYIDSDLRFEPYKNRFKDWITEIEWDTDVLTLTVVTKLTRTTDWMIIEIEREWDMIEVSTSLRWRAPTDSCSLVFYDADVELKFDWCGVETDLEISVDDDGLDEVVAEFSDLALARISWCTFDLEFTRTNDKTAVKLAPSATLETSWCEASFDLEFEGEFPNAPHLLPLMINEAVASWEIGEWDLELTAILEPSNWIAKTYWLELEADIDIDLGCCGEASLELTWLWTESTLGRSRFVLSYESEPSLSMAIECDVDLEDGELDQIALTVGTEW